MTQEMTDHSDIVRVARDLALTEADAFMSQLGLTETEQAYVVGQSTSHFNLALDAYEMWTERGLDLRMMSITSSLAVATHIADRLEFHVNRLLDEQEGK